MKLFQRMVFAAVLAGLAAGVVMSGLQQWRVAPLILQAETYEEAAPPPTHDHPDLQPGMAAENTADHAHGHDADAAWSPADGFERIAYTLAADLLVALGFALMLAAVSMLIGIPVTAANGVLWGIGGFVALHLAPAFGLPPELPGLPSADLGARQAWWLGTAVATGTGLLLIAKYRNWAAIGAGVLLVIAPHVIGAPAPPAGESAVPAHLATNFASSALTTSAVFWLLLGPLYGYVFQRLGQHSRPAGARVPA